MQSTSPAIVAQKSALRREMRDALRALPADAKAAMSSAVCRALVESEPFLASRTIALFAALPDEPDVASLAVASPKSFVFPRIEGDELVFHRVGAETEWKTGPFRVREPDADSSEAVPDHEIDLVVVPGMAFSSDGLRLGRGRGFYDRLLARLPARVRRVGVGFSCQVVGSVPVDVHDAPLDGIITELGWAPV